MFKNELQFLKYREYTDGWKILFWRIRPSFWTLPQQFPELIFKQDKA